MPSILRKPDTNLSEQLPPKAPSRSERLQDLVNLHLNGHDEVCLLYWRPEQSQWVVWAGPLPQVDPFPEAGVTIAP